MTKLAKSKPRNFVAKNAQRSGAGAHQPKTGPLASRARQKEIFRNALKDGNAS